MNKKRKQSVSEEIDSFLAGGKTDPSVVQKLWDHDEMVWRLLLQEVSKDTVEIRFSNDLMLVLETNGRVWQFMEKYLRKMNVSIKESKRIPLLDLSEFCNYLRFRREVLRSNWHADKKAASTVIKCAKLLLDYRKGLEALQDEGSLTIGSFEDELVQFFRVLNDIVSGISDTTELDKLQAQAYEVGLMK